MGYVDYLDEVVPDISARLKTDPATVRHLIAFYGSRAERVLELAKMEPALEQTISPESGDIYAQVLYSVMEEGARSLSDIVLRRMHIGMTAGRALKQAEKIAEIAGKELNWDDDEKRRQIDGFKKTLDKETSCLKV